MSVYQVGELFGRAYMRTATVETAVNVFAKCGIFPFDRLKFGPHDFLVEGCSDLSASTTSTPPNTAEAVSSTSKAVSKPPNTAEAVPSTSKAVSPADLRPLPTNIPGKKSKAGRKRGKAVVVTSYPYKTELVGSLNKKAEENTLTTKNPTKTKKSKGKNLKGNEYKPKIGKKVAVAVKKEGEDASLKVVRKLDFLKKRLKKGSMKKDHTPMTPIYVFSWCQQMMKTVLMSPTTFSVDNPTNPTVKGNNG